MVKLDPKPAVPVLETDSIGVVFLLTVNGRAVRQVYRLINSLFSERHYFYIHVDSVSMTYLIYILHRICIKIHHLNHRFIFYF